VLRIPGWMATLPVRGDTSVPGPSGLTDGATGNARLTSATGVVLIVLLTVEGVTVLSVRQMITLHVFVGVMVLGPVLLKSGSTVYRFVRFYTGAPTYREKGPPHPLLRVLGPLVIVSSLALLGTGIALIVVGAAGSDGLVVAHQTCFWVWVAVLAVHLIGHLWETAITAWYELRSSLRGKAARQRRWRYTAIIVALVVGVGAATALLPTATSWTTRQVGTNSGRPGGPPPP
jgi:hypothetical protein